MTRPLMLFAAGLGRRMGVLTRDRPKPLIKVAGTALIDHALLLATAANAAPIVVNSHYNAPMLQAHLAQRDVQISHEPQLLETGGGLRHALPMLGSGPVFTMNSDAVWQGPNPLTHLQQGWQAHMQGLLLLIPPLRAHGHKGPGDFALNPDGRLQRREGAIYSGVQIIRTDLLHQFPQQGFSLNLLWDVMIAQGGLHGVLYPGDWCDVGQPESIPLAESLINV